MTDKNKPIILSIARLDRVKNITGLSGWHGKNPCFQGLVNLMVVAGDHAKESMDLKEQEEKQEMYRFIEEYKLVGKIRWISAQMNFVGNGELYCCIADIRGAFV